MIKPFFNRSKIFKPSKKDQENYNKMSDNFEEAKKKIDEIALEFKDKKSNDVAQLAHGNTILLHTAFKKIFAEIQFIDFENLLFRKIDKRFEYYVQRDAVKGFIIIAVGISLEITSYLTDL